MALEDISGMIGTDVVLSKSYQSPLQTLEKERERNRKKEQEAYKRKQDRNQQISEYLDFNPEAFAPYQSQVNADLNQMVDYLQKSYKMGVEPDPFLVKKLKDKAVLTASKSKVIELGIGDVDKVTKANAVLSENYFKNKWYDTYLDETGMGKDINSLNARLPEDFYTGAGASEGYDKKALGELALSHFADHKVREYQNLGLDMYQITQRNQKPFVDAEGRIDMSPEDVEVLKENPYVNRYVQDQVLKGVSEKQAVENLMRPQVKVDAGVSKVGRSQKGNGPFLKFTDAKGYTSAVSTFANVLDHAPSVLKNANETKVFDPTTGERYLDVTKQFSGYKLAETNTKRFLFVLPSKPGKVYVANKNKGDNVRKVKYEHLKELDLNAAHGLMEDLYINSKDVSSDDYKNFISTTGGSLTQAFDMEQFRTTPLDEDEQVKVDFASMSLKEGKKRLEIQDLNLISAWKNKTSKEDFAKQMNELFEGVSIELEGDQYEKIEFLKGKNVRLTKADGEVTKLDLEELQEALAEGGFEIDVEGAVEVDERIEIDW